MPRLIFRLAILLLGAVALHATGDAASHDKELLYILLDLIVLLLAAKLGGEIVERLGQPAVLGELGAGMILGNLHLAGFHLLEPLKTHHGLEVVAEIGVILLLFDVGLESHIKELMAVGLSAMMVAVVGVVAPMLLGYGVSMIFLPAESWYVHMFVGATLTATSVGITARVLKDLRKTESKEARIILGAAVVDDVLGLMILAVVSGMVVSIAAGGQADLSAGPILIILLKAAAFLIGAIVVGRFLHVSALRAGKYFRVPGVPLVLAICHCFGLAAIAGAMGLAPIVGAFAAGLVLEAGDYEVFLKRGEQPIDELLKPITTLFVPIFFVFMGLKVDLRSFSSPSVLLFAAVLTVVAILGKQVCSLGVLEGGVKRLIIGVGMIPRGEVGLIFTGMGASLLVAGKPVFSPETVSAMVVMVMLTTLMTPPLLKFLFNRPGARK